MIWDILQFFATLVVAYLLMGIIGQNERAWNHALEEMEFETELSPSEELLIEAVLDYSEGDEDAHEDMMSLAKAVKEQRGA